MHLKVSYSIAKPKVFHIGYENESHQHSSDIPPTVLKQKSFFHRIDYHIRMTRVIRRDTHNELEIIKGNHIAICKVIHNIGMTSSRMTMFPTTYTITMSLMQKIRLGYQDDAGQYKLIRDTTYLAQCWIELKVRHFWKVKVRSEHRIRSFVFQDIGQTLNP